MKKMCLGLIIGLMLGIGVSSYAAPAWKVELQKAKILVNGNVWTSKDKPALAVDGYTYLSLAAIGDAMNIPYRWNDKHKQVEIGTFTQDKAETSQIFNAGDLQITFKSGAYRARKNMASFDIEIKNKSSTPIEYNMARLVPGAHESMQDFIDDSGEEITRGTLAAGESKSGVLSGAYINIETTYAFRYDYGGNKYEFTFNNK